MKIMFYQVESSRIIEWIDNFLFCTKDFLLNYFINVCRSFESNKSSIKNCCYLCGNQFVLIKFKCKCKSKMKFLHTLYVQPFQWLSFDFFLQVFNIFSLVHLYMLLFLFSIWYSGSLIRFFLINLSFSPNDSQLEFCNLILRVYVYGIQ